MNKATELPRSKWVDDRTYQVGNEPGTEHDAAGRRARARRVSFDAHAESTMRMLGARR